MYLFLLAICCSHTSFSKGNEAKNIYREQRVTSQADVINANPQVPSANAKTTIISVNANRTYLKWLTVKVGGEERFMYTNESGSQDSGSYKHKGYADGSRVRGSIQYNFTPNTYIKGYYSTGLDYAHVLHMSGHYDPASKRLSLRQRFIAIGNDDYGIISFGKQKGPYYLAVGIKEDLWYNDTYSSPVSAGVDGDYDIGNWPRRSVSYINNFGDLNFYAQASAPAQFKVNNKLRYRRKGGGQFAVNYKFSDDLDVAAAYLANSAEIETLNKEKSKDKVQQVFGGGLEWKPKSWVISFTANYYKNFLGDFNSYTDFFAKEGFGGHIYFGYNFKLPYKALYSINPYFASDRRQTTKGKHSQLSHEYIGLRFNITKSLTLNPEYTITQSTNDDPSVMNLYLQYAF